MYCNKLFELERKYAERGYRPETRKKHRLKDEKPVIEAFIAWADKQPASGNGKFSKAVTYLRGRRNYLMTYLEDGRCSISNNWYIISIVIEQMEAWTIWGVSCVVIPRVG